MRNFNIYSFIKLSVFLVFIGRSYQFIFWSQPLAHIVKEGSLGYSYAWINLLVIGMGIVLLLSAIATLFVKDSIENRAKEKHLRWTILLGSGCLFIHSIAIMISSGYDIFQLIENSTQLFIPIILLTYNRLVTINKLELTLKLMIAATFISHGLYAMNYLPIPSSFVAMTMKILSLDGGSAMKTLYIMGTLDLLVAFLIFVPKIKNYALTYVFIWGVVTAFARLVAGFDTEFISMSLHQHVYQSVYRIPHGLVGLALLIVPIVKESSKS